MPEHPQWLLPACGRRSGTAQASCKLCTLLRLQIGLVCSSERWLGRRPRTDLLLLLLPPLVPVRPPPALLLPLPLLLLPLRLLLPLTCLLLPRFAPEPAQLLPYMALLPSTA